MSPQMHLGFAQDICALVLVFALPFVDFPTARRLKQESNTEKRLAWYRLVTLALWLVTASAIACSGYRRLFITPRHLGELPWLDAHRWLYIFAATMTAAYFMLGLWPGLHSIMSRQARPKYSRAMKSLRFFLPVSRDERYWWALVSLTAGICEEILFRGFLLQYLRGHLDGGPSMSLVHAWLVSSLAFGFGHIYQGWAGVCRTTLGGLAFGLLAILTGNLALPILLHCLLDLQVLVIYRPTLDAPEEAAALPAGCNCES
jgi:membrane protease YdiL (CAAX protease family)